MRTGFHIMRPGIAKTKSTHVYFFIFNYWRSSALYMGSLISLFWTYGDVCPGFQRQDGLPSLCACVSICVSIFTSCKKYRYLSKFITWSIKLFTKLAAIRFRTDVHVRLTWTHPKIYLIDTNLCTSGNRRHRDRFRFCESGKQNCFIVWLWWMRGSEWILPEAVSRHLINSIHQFSEINYCHSSMTELITTPIWK